jgi:hypothetical protein
MTIFYFISPFFPESGLSNKNPFAWAGSRIFSCLPQIF